MVRQRRAAALLALSSCTKDVVVPDNYPYSGYYADPYSDPNYDPYYDPNYDPYGVGDDIGM